MTHAYRDASSGEFVTADFAAANPDTTIRETLPDRREQDSIDHARAAVGLLTAVGKETGDGPIPASLAVAVAQVHATLALAEEQRTANRLDVAALDQVSVYGHAPEEFRIRPYLTEAEWARLNDVGDAAGA